MRACLNLNVAAIEIDFAQYIGIFRKIWTYNTEGLCLLCRVRYMKSRLKRERAYYIGDQNVKMLNKKDLLLC